MTDTPPPVSPPVGGGGARLRGQLQGRVITGSSWIMAGFVVQAITGLAFWVTAAHAYGADQVGIAAGLFASMQFVIYATALGLQEILALSDKQKTKVEDDLTRMLERTHLDA